jgi:hypothetical protein
VIRRTRSPSRSSGSRQQSSFTSCSQSGPSKGWQIWAETKGFKHTVRIGCTAHSKVAVFAIRSHSAQFAEIKLWTSITTRRTKALPDKKEPIENFVTAIQVGAPVASRTRRRIGTESGFQKS